MAAPALASAANSAELTASTEEILIAVNVDQNVIHFPVAHSGDTMVAADVPEGNAPINVTNAGTVSADFVVSGTDATEDGGTGTWTLSETANGPQAFRHLIGTEGGMTYSPLSTSLTDLVSDVGVGASSSFSNFMDKPTANGSTGAKYSWKVNILAVESL